MLSPGDVVLHSFDLQHGVDVFEAGSALVNSKLKRLQSMQYAFKKKARKPVRATSRVWGHVIG